MSKGGTADIAVDGLGPEELCVVENVETFQPKLERFRFGQAHILEKSHIVVLQPRSVEKAPLGVARRTQSIFAELRGIEIRPSVARIVIQIESASQVVRLINAIIVDAVRFGPEQRIVAVVDERHGKSSAEMGDSGNFPSLRPAV